MKKYIFLFAFLSSISGFSQLVSTQYTTNNGLASDRVGKLFKDHSGNLWIGTQYGLTKKTGNLFINFTTSNGLPDNSILSITEDSAGYLYIGTANGAAKFDGVNFTTYDSLVNQTVTSILIDHNHYIWFGTYYHGIYVFDGTNWTHYNENNGITLYRVYALFEDTNHVIYAGGFSGYYEINCFQNNTWTYLTTDTTPSAKAVFCFAKDSNGYIWASGYNKQGSYFLEFTGGNNFYVNYVNNFLRITYYQALKSEFIFSGSHQIISTAKNGLLFYDLSTGQESVINEYNDFPYNVSSIQNDNGNLWLGTNFNGLLLISNYQDLKPHNFYEYLNINNWSVRLNNSGNLFWNPLVGKPESFIPKDSLKSTLFLGTLWIGGLDALDSLHLMGEEFYMNTETWTGPLANDYDSYDYYNKYNRLWKVSKSEIDYHRNHYNDVGYIMPEGIKSWPGNGDTTNGEFAIMAPFADVNGNNIYEPEQGDYPLIRGDQAVYFIYNDARRDTHSFSGGIPLGLEIHAMAYAYQETGTLNNTFFINYQIFNKSDTDYHDVYIGLDDDFDIGNYSDDYTGCDSTRNIFYGYNGDDYDEGSNGYGLHPPAQGIMFLNQTMTHFGYFINGINDPNSAQDFYEILKFSYPAYGNINSNYAFEFHSGYTEEDLGFPPSDQRGVGSIGPFTLNAGDNICVDIAFPWARTDTGGAYQSLLDLLQDADEIQTFYDQQGYICSLTQNIVQNVPANAYIRIYPNPTTGKLMIKTADMKNYQVSVYSLLGRKLQSYKNVKELNLNSLSKGIYLIKISSDKVNYTQRIIVQ